MKFFFFLLASFFWLDTTTTTTTKSVVVDALVASRPVVANSRCSSDSSHSVVGLHASTVPDVSSTTSPIDSDEQVQVCLETLEKRVQQGPGALTPQEISDLETATAKIVADLQQQQQQQEPVVEEEESSSSFTRITTAPFMPVVPSNTPQKNIDPELQLRLRSAVSQLDAATVARLATEEGVTMDETTADAAFWAIVQAVDQAEARDQPLSANVPRMLHHLFEADQRLLKQREHLRANITCMQPDEATGTSGAARRMNYIFDDSAHKDLPLAEGRKCEGGTCCDACSRNIFPTFARPAECDLQTFPELAKLTFNDLETVSAATILQFVRLVERVRRTMAYEYGLDLKTILPLQAYSRKYVAGTTQKGGGGGEGDFVTLHTDEATHSGYHYSCVLYLNSQGVDFEGGDFVFNDPDVEAQKAMAEKEKREQEQYKRSGGAAAQVLSLEEEMEKLQNAAYDDEPYMSLEEEMEQFRYAGRHLTPFSPTQGAAVIFSSGWENMHEVHKITSGVRYVVPCFFTTCPVPDAAYQQMVAGKPKTDEDIADDWLHLLLAHREETPMESVGRVKELLMKWHYMCTPLSEH